MPREFSRTIRVAQSIRRTLAPLVNDWVRENHSGMASVTQADVSPDLKRSRVYVSLYGCEDTASIVTQLNRQAGRFRHALGGELRLRNLPAIEFCLDESIEQGDKVSRMLETFKTGGRGD
ncbi:MAG TPA: 30S ribosome-binding factor RbfA [Gammaproteobacteria bacterium]|nr:30S ribosome-binding factor RbfA [Gammaproteobacteria bacterium]